MSGSDAARELLHRYGYAAEMEADVRAVEAQVRGDATAANSWRQVAACIPGEIMRSLGR